MKAILALCASATLVVSDGGSSQSVAPSQGPPTISDAQNFLVKYLPDSARIQFYQYEAAELRYKVFEFEKVAFIPKRQCVLGAKVKHEEHKDLIVGIDFSNIEGTRDFGEDTLKPFESGIQLQGYVDVGTTAKAKRLHSPYLMFSTVKMRDRAGKAITILVESCKTQEPI